VIDSIFGKVEVRKAGGQTWKAVQKGAVVANNDMVRTLDSSSVRLSLPNGGRSYMSANSQILVNCFENTQARSISQHIMIYWGAVFFMIRATLPQEFFGRDDTKIFTQTTVVAIRGTSFDVSVDKKTAVTEVRVLNGTVLVRNAMRNVSTFLKAGYKTSVSVNSDPQAPTPYADKHIDELARWVPRKVIEDEMRMQIGKSDAAQSASVAQKNLVLVAPFTNASEYKGTWDLSARLAAEVAERLRGARTGVAEVKVLPGDDPLALGEKNGARYVVKGVVEDFDIVRRARVTAGADQYLEYNTARVRLRLQLIDIAHKELVYDEVFTGEAVGPNTPENGWPEIAKLHFDLKDASFGGSILGKAVTQSVGQYVTGLLTYLRNVGE
jgi:hypothetical protein